MSAANIHHELKFVYEVRCASARPAATTSTTTAEIEWQRERRRRTGGRMAPGRGEAVGGMGRRIYPFRSRSVPRGLAGLATEPIFRAVATPSSRASMRLRPLL